MAVALALLLAGAVPHFAAAAGRLRMEQAAFGMARTLRSAHELAVTQERVVTWAWDEATRRARLAQAGEDGRVSWLTGAIGQTDVVPSALTVAVDFEESEEPGQLLFFPDGTSQPGTLHLSDARGGYTITVDATTGQPRLAADASPD